MYIYMTIGLLINSIHSYLIYIALKLRPSVIKLLSCGSIITEEIE